MEMNREIGEKLARSLTAETTDLLPFLPYLLQDLWELGSSPKDMIYLLEKYLVASDETKILDLACGKGAVSINLAKELGVKVRGIDLLQEFIEYANEKAKEWGVDLLCNFICADVNEAVVTERGYDCVIFGAAGNILGGPHETLAKLKETIRPGGFILIDEAYLPDGAHIDIKYDYEYLNRQQWMQVFKDNDLELLEELIPADDYDYDSDNRAIAARAEELGAKYPDKRGIFEDYIQSQRNEIHDLENSLIGVTWILRKK